VIVLAIESATIEVGVALTGPAGLLAALVARPGRRHVETLHPAVEAICAAAGVSLGAVDAIAVDVGPGLFTGIRVGVAAAKAFAFALAVPVVACSSIEVLAYAGRDMSVEVVPVVDMRRGEVAWALPDSAGALAVLPAAGSTSGAVAAAAVPRGVRLGGVDELAGELAACARPLLLVGDGARRYGDHLVEEVVARGGVAPAVAGDTLGAPPVASLAELGARRAIAGSTTSAVELTPIYLRAPDVRINWAQRAVAPSPSGPVAPSTGGTAAAPTSAARR
jgi:tRNA threonylcarbamoyladenosine biosynthesis protein TsaB